MKRFVLNAKGMTLVEILIALSILALIGAVSIPNLRRFNDTQALENAANDLVRVLREAQSSANSRVSCSNTLIAREWVVRLAGGSYRLEANCYNPVTGSLSAPEVRYQPDPQIMVGIAISSRTPSVGSCAVSSQVVFSAEYKPFDRQRFSNISYDCSTTDNKMEINLAKSGSHIYICLDKGGAINASPNACF